MFGIGLPELILILALALIVVGPDKLPDMAKAIAKQLLELKKTANALKDSLQEELKEDELKEGARPWEKLEPPLGGTEINDSGIKNISVQPQMDTSSDVFSAEESDGVYVDELKVVKKQEDEPNEQQEGKKSG